MQFYKYTGSLYITFPSVTACKPVNKCYSVESCSFLWGTTRWHREKPALWLKYLPLMGGHEAAGLEGIWILSQEPPGAVSFLGSAISLPSLLQVKLFHLAGIGRDTTFWEALCVLTCRDWPQVPLHQGLEMISQWPWKSGERLSSRFALRGRWTYLKVITPGVSRSNLDVLREDLASQMFFPNPVSGLEICLCNILISPKGEESLEK